MTDTQPRYYRFEPFRLDTRARELREDDGAPLSLTAKAFDTLCYLIEHRQRLVGKDELLAAIWPGRVVEENNLTQAIAALRRALGTNAGEHRYIVTVPGRGYRFIADVHECEADAVVTPEPVVDATTGARALPATPAWHRAITFGAVLFMLSLFAIAAWRMREAPVLDASRHDAQRTALAVLPFRSLSNGPRDEGLEIGLADTLITRLSRSDALQVRSLTSSQRLSGASLDAKAAGRELGAAYVVEGTTQRAEDQVRINARLVSVADGGTVWAETFDAPIARVFTLQDRMGDAVVAALKLSPVAPPTHPRSPCDGDDALAYRAWLRGYYEINRPDSARLPVALAAFREAIDRDPTCARAWAGTAFAYRAQVMTADRDPREMFPLAKAAVARALAIDPDSAEAWTSKGFIEFWYDWDWPAAEASLRHAVALNPNLAEAHMALAHLLVNIGRGDEAVPHARQAAALDPLSPLVNALAAAFLGEAGLKDEAGRHLRKTLELEPDAWVALRIRASRAMASGDHAQAISDLRRAAEISHGSSQILDLLGQAYLQAGDRPAAERVLADLEERRRRDYAPATSLALLVNALGDTERALDLLEQGYRERDVRMSFLLRDSGWDNLRTQPRFRALLQKMRLEAPSARAGSWFGRAPHRASPAPGEDATSIKNPVDSIARRG
jgi:TolB-like protein/DNA-binding winged helix-turn-helix (wHTH) protein/Flp pilus assembly protein TadD